MRSSRRSWSFGPGAEPVLFGRPAIYRVKGDRLCLVAHHGPIPIGPVGEFTIPIVRGTISGRAVLDQRTVHVADVLAETKEFPESSPYARQHGTRTSLCVPMMREGLAIATIHLRRTEAQLFTQRQVALLQTFADQAVVASRHIRVSGDKSPPLLRINHFWKFARLLLAAPNPAFI